MNNSSETKYSVEMNDIGTMEIDIKGEYNDRLVLELRKKIDRYWGNWDGTVTPNEVKNYLDYFELSENNSTNTSGIKIDNHEGIYSKYDISLNGVEGDSDSKDSISITASIIATWPSLESDRDFHDITINLYIETCEIFKFKCPPGFEIYRVTGLTNEKYNNNTTITGNIKNDPIYIVIIKAGAQITTPQGSLTFSNVQNNSDIINITFDGSVERDLINISLYDASLNTILIINRLSSDENIEIPINGLIFIYRDNNGNEELDTPDTLSIQNGAVGDKISVFYKPTGEVIASLILT